MSTTTADYYSVLGVETTASQDEIRAAYRRLAKQFHPDVNPEGAERFRLATDAYQVLSDPDRRARYDAGHSDADEDGLTVDDLDAYFRAVRSILGDDELVDVGPVLLKIESEGKELPTSLGLLFVGPRAAVFIDSHARAGAMQGRVAPIHFNTLLAHPDLRSDHEGSAVRLVARDDADYVAYIVGAAPLLGSLQGVASAAFKSSKGGESASSRVTSGPMAYESGSSISLGRIVRWVLTTLFILGLIGKLLTAMGAGSDTTSAEPPSNPDTGSVQPVDPAEGTGTPEDDPTSPDPVIPADSWEAAKASFGDYSSGQGGDFSRPVPGSGNTAAVAVSASAGLLFTHAFQDGSWESTEVLTPDFTDEMQDVTFQTVDTTGQGGADILVQFQSDDGTKTGTVVLNTGEFAAFTDAEGDYGFIDGLDYQLGELVALGSDGEPYLTLEYMPGEGTFELTGL